MELEKYPRTLHLPWSNYNKEDVVLKDINCFKEKTLIVTEKMDGENTSFTKDKFWPRSLDSTNHPSRNYVKGIWGNIRHLIPQNMIICGENMYAKHSIYYDNLESYFLVFNIWIGNVCLSWDNTLYWCEQLNLKTVPVWKIFKRPSNTMLLLLNKAWHDGIHETKDWNKHEGYVVRNIDSFLREDFSTNVAKYVRKKHVQSNVHWTKDWTLNKLSC